MSALGIVEQHLKSWPQPTALGDTNVVVVHTHFLYPSMSVVKAFVECHHATMRVSDGGGALHELAGIGPFQFDPVKMLRARARSWDLSVSQEGWVWSNAVPVERLADMIAWVSTASHDLAANLLNKMTARPKAADFRQELNTFFEKRYTAQVKRDTVFVGASNKRHRFDYFISMNGDVRGILIDAVMNDASSINSAVVAHLDVAKTELPHVKQRVIYDDREDWKAADLSLLRVGATPLAFSRLESNLVNAIRGL